MEESNGSQAIVPPPTPDTADDQYCLSRKEKKNKALLDCQLKMKQQRQHKIMMHLILLTITVSVSSDKFCGTDQADADNTCWQPCGSDADCCSLGQRCYEAGSSCGSSVYDGEDNMYCGVR